MNAKAPESRLLSGHDARDFSISIGGGRKTALSHCCLTEMSQEADTVEVASDGRVEQ